MPCNIDLLGCCDGLPVWRHTGQLRLATTRHEWLVLDWSLMEYYIVVQRELWSVVTDDCSPLLVPEGVAMPIHPHDFGHLDDSHMCPEFPVVCLPTGRGQPFFPFRSDCYGNVPYHRWRNPPRYIVLTTGHSERSLDFYIYLMHVYNIFCDRTSCWKFEENTPYQRLSHHGASQQVVKLVDGLTVAWATKEHPLTGYGQLTRTLRMQQFDFPDLASQPEERLQTCQRRQSQQYACQSDKIDSSTRKTLTLPHKEFEKLPLCQQKWSLSVRASRQTLSTVELSCRLGRSEFQLAD